MYQKTGIGLIFISCIVVFFKGDLDNILCSLMILCYSFIYSVIGCLMECYKEKSDIIQIKLVSCFFHMCSYFFYSIFYASIIQNPSYGLILLTIFVGASECIYYYLKNRIIQSLENGSIYINILDIIRRVVTLMLGILLFSETNPSYLYYFYGVMLLGCLLFYFNEQIKKCLNRETAPPREITLDAV
jgi:hypothetical protein